MKDPFAEILEEDPFEEALLKKDDVIELDVEDVVELDQQDGFLGIPNNEGVGF